MQFAILACNSAANAFPSSCDPRGMSISGELARAPIPALSLYRLRRHRLQHANKDRRQDEELLPADEAQTARTGSVTVELLPHETRILDVQSDFFGGGRNMSILGGISLEHNGLAGAVLARGFAQEAAKRYSLAVQFSDPQASKSSGYQGAGLRLGAAGGELTQVAVAHNAGVAEAVVTGRLPYTTADGVSALVSLPEVRLAPGETEAIDITGAIKDANIPQEVTVAGLEFEYSTEPGSVQMTALSVGDNGDQLFRLPLWDVAAQRSATGRYPWFIDGSSSTVVYLKNVTPEPQEYTLRLGFDGGEYLVGVRSIEPHQSLTFDLRELRDNQIPDDNGVTIPLTAERGQIIWSVYGPDGLAMIGRSEQADIAKGVNNNYACQSCCPDSYVASTVEPVTASVEIGGMMAYVAKEQRSTCNGQPAGWYTVGAAWSSLDNSVVTVSSGGVATGVAPGSANIKATWTAYSRFPSFGGCESTSFQLGPVAPINVRPTISGPNTMWWFNGAAPGNTNMPISIQLTTQSGASSYSWTVTANANKLLFRTRTPPLLP